MMTFLFQTTVTTPLVQEEKGRNDRKRKKETEVRPALKQSVIIRKESAYLPDFSFNSGSTFLWHPGFNSFPLSPIQALTHAWREKSLVSPLQLFLLVIIQNFYAITKPKKRSSRYVHLASDAPGLRSGGEGAQLVEINNGKVGLRAMTAVFVYFFVWRNALWLSRLQLHRRACGREKEEERGGDGKHYGEAAKSLQPGPRMRL